MNYAESCSSADSAKSMSKRKRMRSTLVPVPCPICGEDAIHKHFRGAISCEGCAAFFRRSTVQNRIYRCKWSSDCDLTQREGKSICKACRYRRCFEIGMQQGAVIASDSPKLLFSTPDSPLAELVRSKNATYFTRNCATINIYGGEQYVIPMAHRHKYAGAVAMAVRAERSVFREFVESCRLFDDSMPSGFLEALMADFFHTWLNYNGVLHTIRNLGFTVGKAYFVDESFCQVNEDNMISYFRSDKYVKDPRAVTRHSMPYFYECLAIAEKIHEFHLDEVEQMAVIKILLLKCAAKLVDDPKCLFRKLNAVFKALSLHYTHNYDDIALRMGNIVLIMENVQQLRHMFDEHVVFMQVSGNGSVIERPEDYSPRENRFF